MIDINSFFLTKLAEEKKDPIIDPGEAASAGLAMTFSPFSKFIVPRVLRTILSKTYAPTASWTGDAVYGLKGIEEAKRPQELIDLVKATARAGGKMSPERAVKQGLIGEALFEKMQTPQDVLGGLFRIKPRKKDITKLDPRLSMGELNKLVDMQKSVNSMLDRYKLPEKGVTLSFRSGPISKLLGARYNIPSKEIVLPKVSKHLALHEIGHAAHFTQKGAPAARLIRNTIYRGSTLAVPMAYIAGDEIQKMFPGKIDDKVVDFIQRHAPAILASTYAASTLYPEVQATARAISHVYKTEGKQAAKEIAKKLTPRFLSYTMPLIPAMVGMGMAKKWHREAKENRRKLEEGIGKEAGIFSDMGNFLHNVRLHSSNVIKQVGEQGGYVLGLPTGKFMNEMYRSGKNVLKSPEFAAGAAVAGIPAAIISYLKFNTPHGAVYAEKKRQYGFGEKLSFKGKGSPASEIEYQTVRSKQDATTPAIVGITAALSGGFLSKLFTDLGRIM